MTRPTPAEIEEAVGLARRLASFETHRAPTITECETLARALLAVVEERDDARSWFERLRAVAPTTAEVESVLDDHDFARDGLKGASDADE